MSANPTQDQLRRASAEHVRSARAVLVSNSGTSHQRRKISGNVGIAPKSAAYLAHVAVECAIKLRLLRHHSRLRTEEMRSALGEELFQTLFRSKQGHDLRLLAQHASLRRQLAADGKEEILNRAAWIRMTSPERPFDLRYGTATTTEQDALDELAIAQALIDAIHTM